MKRFLRTLGRLFWSWGFLKFVLWAITLIILFYAEEDWRGAHAWAVTKAKWEAKGETFSLAKFVPPPLTVDQNLAAMPVFKLESVAKDRNIPEPLALERAMRQGLMGGDLPAHIGNWTRGELPNMAELRLKIAANYKAAFPFAKPPSDSLAQFDSLYPFLANLRAIAAQRPFFRPEQDYVASPPAARSLGPITIGIMLSKLVTLHALLALDAHRSDLALRDIKVTYVILSGMQRDPSIVGGLVAVGMLAINNNATYSGLAAHAWTDAQLLLLEQMLGSIDLLGTYQFDIRAETADSAANIDRYSKSSTHLLLQLSDGSLPTMVRFAPPWPMGWWNANKAELADFLLRELAVASPPAHRMFPEVAIQLNHDLDQATRRWDANAPWRIFFTLAAHSLANANQHFAEGQVRLDEARIACALERYWLAHHAYPAALDALVPDQIAALPHDVINGEPYHYRLRPDGTYLLYSVGWDQHDDGGKLAFKANGSIDEDHGDWVWPTSK
jgi:hypothetical protein